ncbi:hypothetical protein DE146DRAFT_132114 [Phaeosphaeria sp. MPI-PUGE-AT-0046c]|nr:hypothetical protein DE146DRAFT_132114 [Phaeosphaeria sp. MPI-PUGE-AT-0046c]
MFPLVNKFCLCSATLTAPSPPLYPCLLFSNSCVDSPTISHSPLTPRTFYMPQVEQLAIGSHMVYFLILIRRILEPRADELQPQSWFPTSNPTMALSRLLIGLQARRRSTWLCTTSESERAASKIGLAYRAMRPWISSDVEDKPLCLWSSEPGSCSHCTPYGQSHPGTARRAWVAADDVMQSHPRVQL